MKDPEIILYVAASLDGFIARENGSVEWLDEMENPDKSDFGYKEFIREIDTVIMGRKTYDLVLGFDTPWPYKGIRNFVVSRKKNLDLSTPETELVNDFSPATIEYIKKGSKKNIWLIGGGELVTQGLRLGVIDRIILCIIPRVLGSGIPLFPDNPPDTVLELLDSVSYRGGAVMLTYAPKQKR